jgi:two-component system chemotaxis response regulator CheY
MDSRPLLVVEDQESMRQLILSALRGLGFVDILTAQNGHEALRMLRGRPIALTFLDVEMPVMGGFDTLKEIRADKELAKAPVVMVTSRADAPFIRAIMPLGVSGYLVKPVTAAALKATIDRTLRPQASKAS